MQVSKPQGFIMHLHRRTTPTFRDKHRKCPLLKHKLVRIKMDHPSLPSMAFPKGTEFAFQGICLEKSSSKCLNDLLLQTQSFALMLVKITRNYLFHHKVHNYHWISSLVIKKLKLEESKSLYCLNLGFLPTFHHDRVLRTLIMNLKGAK